MAHHIQGPSGSQSGQGLEQLIQMIEQLLQQYEQQQAQNGGGQGPNGGGQGPNGPGGGQGANGNQSGQGLQQLVNQLEQLLQSYEQNSGQSGAGNQNIDQLLSAAQSLNNAGDSSAAMGVLLSAMHQLAQQNPSYNSNNFNSFLNNFSSSYNYAA
jgi:ElaB/YqjD/DUF883 family membrane-anchored ribosome-binding protein